MQGRDDRITVFGVAGQPLAQHGIGQGDDGGGGIDARNRQIDRALAETATADAGHTGGRRGEGQSLAVAVEAAGHPGIDEAGFVRREMRFWTTLGAGWEGLRWHHGAAQRQHAGDAAHGLNHRDGGGRTMRRTDDAKRNVRRQSVRAAARRDQTGLAKICNIHQRGVAAPRRHGGEPFRRPPQGDNARRASERIRFRQRSQRRAWHDDAAAVLRAGLRGEGLRIEGVVQVQCATAEQPRQQRQRQSGERAQRDCRQQHPILRRAALEIGPQTAGNHFFLVARDRADALGAFVEGYDGNVGRGVTRARRRRFEIKRASRQQSVERHHAVRQIASEAADIADLKQFGGHLHRGLGKPRRSGVRRRDKRLGAERLERGHDVPLAPQQRQRRGNHAGAQHAEQHDHTLHGVGKLHRHHGVGLQTEPAQLRGRRRYRAVGLRISQFARRTAGEAFAVRRIGQRDGIDVAQRRAAEKIVERGAAYGRFGTYFKVSVAQDHGLSPCHHVSGK